MGPRTYNLLEDYGKLALVQVETVALYELLVLISGQSKNAQMMYECAMNSITDEAKASLPSCELDFHEDGPTLFFDIVKHLSMETFSNPQAMWDKLSEFHPKHFKHDIFQVNNYIQAAVKTLYATSSASGTITNQEF